MTGAINYVRREGRYVMKYYLVDVISVWRPPSDFLQQRQTWKNWSFYHLLFTPFADMALFMLNRIKRQCDKYYNGVPNSKMSADGKNICLQFISDIQSQVITDARLEYINCGSESGTVQQATGNVSVNPAVDGCLFFSGL